jgi:tetratricopeptide (TPR) repeat protein
LIPKKETYLILLLLVTWQFSAAQINHSDSSESDFSPGISPREQIASLIYLADSLLTIYPDQSLDYARQALKLSEKQNYDEGRLKAMNRIADISWQKTDLQSSLRIANEAKELALQTDNQHEYAEAILIIGKVNLDLGDYNKSSEMNFEALQIFEKENDKVGTGKALSRIGFVYFDQGNWDKALEYYSLSLQIAREVNDLVGISRGLNNVAAVYGNKKEYRNLEKNIKEAVEINRKTGHKLWEGINYINLANVNKDENKYDTAFYYFKKADSIFTELNNVPKMVAVNIGLSKYFSDLNDFERSLYYAKMAYKLGEDNELKKWVFVAARRLHDIYLEQNDIERAYEYSSIEYRMKDSLALEKSMTRLSQLELLYDFEKVNQEKKIKQQRKDYIFALTIITIIFIFVLIIILLLARQRIRRKNAIIVKKQFENELEIKNKELTANVMTLMRKNEILSEIADKLMEIRDEAVKDETKSAIKRIARELEKTTDSEIWEEFEIRFKQVHHEFYDKLVQRFPNLSPNEQRLCAFLRLNMTTKEISELTGQRIGTLEIARSRLRKKLNISNTKINLVTFLTQI